MRCPHCHNESVSVDLFQLNTDRLNALVSARAFMPLVLWLEKTVRRDGFAIYATTHPILFGPLGDGDASVIKSIGGGVRQIHEEAVLFGEWPYESEAPTDYRCGGCMRIIDPETCGCGDPPQSSHDGHFFIPAGCDCFRHQPPPCPLCGGTQRNDDVL